MCLQPRHIREAEQYGIRTIVLYGSAAECLAAFLRREEMTGRRLDQDFWIENNAGAYIWYSRHEFALYRMRAFSNGTPRHRAELVAELQSVVAG